MDPRPHSMRRLLQMAIAVKSQQWDHTCSIVAAVANAAYGRKGAPIDPARLHPMKKRRKRRRLTEAMLDEMVGLK